MILSVCLCALWVWSSWGSPAELGSQYANVYTAFAPAYVLHRAYGEYLFNGTAVAVPDVLEGSCVRFSHKLALFHLDYASQTASSSAGGMAFLVRLRNGSAAFCDTYGDWLGRIVGWDGVDMQLLEEASDAGLFAEIKATNDLMEATLDAILEGFGDGIDRWAFGVTFAARSLLDQEEPERISTGLREIFFADPEGGSPPFDIPDFVAVDMARLVELSGRDLAEAESADAIEAAARIHEYFLSAN